MEENKTNKLVAQPSAGYEQLVDRISLLWDAAKSKAVLSVNAELLDANWHTGHYIVEFEQKGKSRAQYGKQHLVNFAKDLTRKRGKGFSRSNLTYMRKLYLAFPKCETLSHKLTWSHYFELLKCDDPLELQFKPIVCRPLSVISAETGRIAGAVKQNHG